MKKVIIFGAGHDGLELLGHLGKERVAFFCDNDEKKNGTKLQGIKIISFDEYLKISNQYDLYLAVSYKEPIRKQLAKSGITEYTEYVNDDRKRINVSVKEVIGAAKTENDKLLDYFVEASKKSDPLNDFYGFRELVRESKRKIKDWMWYDNSVESVYYGHQKAIFEYAGINERERATFPVIIHAAFFRGGYGIYPSAMIFASKYDEEMLHERYAYIPGFCIGPYINYADTVLQRSDIEKIRNKNGHTALVFAMHSTEGDRMTTDYEQIKNDISQRLSKEYDKIYICAYWHDIDAPIYDEFMRMGVEVVSAGFRFDNDFIRRLKTIYELCDSVFVYGMPVSSIGYALSLNKKLYVFDTKWTWTSHTASIPLEMEEMEKKHKWGEWYKILASRKGWNQQDFSQPEKEIIDGCYGLNNIKTPEEIRLIHSISRDIWEACDYMPNYYPHGVYSTYWRYQRNYEFEKLTLLSEALGKGFWVL